MGGQYGTGGQKAERSAVLFLRFGSYQGMIYVFTGGRGEMMIRLAEMKDLESVIKITGDTISDIFPLQCTGRGCVFPETPLQGKCFSRH